MNDLFISYKSGQTFFMYVYISFDIIFICIIFQKFKYSSVAILCHFERLYARAFFAALQIKTE
jgi:hypothetical protein